MTAHFHQGWLALGLSLLVASCSSATSGAPQGTSPQPDAPAQQRRTVVIDGSSTVFPLTEAIAAAYNAEASNPVEVDVSFSAASKNFAPGKPTLTMPRAPFQRQKLPPVTPTTCATTSCRSPLMLSRS